MRIEDNWDVTYTRLTCSARSRSARTSAACWQVAAQRHIQGEGRRICQNPSFSLFLPFSLFSFLVLVSLHKVTSCPLVQTSSLVWKSSLLLLMDLHCNGSLEQEDYVDFCSDFPLAQSSAECPKTLSSCLYERLLPKISKKKCVNRDKSKFATK